jgi:hypothetical protein
MGKRQNPYRGRAKSEQNQYEKALKQIIHVRHQKKLVV